MTVSNSDDKIGKKYQLTKTGHIDQETRLYPPILENRVNFYSNLHFSCKYKICINFISMLSSDAYYHVGSEQASTGARIGACRDQKF